MERDRGRRKPAERLFIDFLRESTAGRSVEALRLLRDLESLMPRSLLVNHNVVEQLLEDNRPNAAVEAYKRLNVDVRTLRHSVGTWRMNVATRALHMAGEYERELEESRLGRQHAPGMLFFDEAEARALAAMGRLDELKGSVDRSLAIPATTGTAGDVLEEAALELRAHGHRQASLEYAGRAVDWWRERSAAGVAAAANRAALGRALYLAGRWDEAEREFTVLAAESPGQPDYIGYLGACAAGRGDAARASEASRILQEHSDPDLPGYRTLWRARLAAVLGERPTCRRPPKGGTRPGRDIRDPHPPVAPLRVRARVPAVPGTRETQGLTQAFGKFVERRGLVEAS